MQNEIITFTSPKSSVSEIFRTLRTNVQFMNASSNQKSILFTSTQSGDGKSWIAANLAVTFAQAGKKVIIVDTDMRRGRMHDLFELSNSKGLSNYLILSTDRPEERLGEYIQATMVENLYVIPAGVVPPNPSELLTSAKMIDLMKVLEGMADIVIYDSTPSTMVTDALAISRYVGTTLIVASYKKTKMEVLKIIKKHIENVGGKVGGVILNNTPSNRKVYGKSYYYESSLVLAEPKKKSKLELPRIFGKSLNSEEENIVEEINQKLDKTEQEKTSKENIGKSEAQNDGVSDNNASENTGDNKIKDDEELNMLLKQLTRYLETK